MDTLIEILPEEEEDLSIEERISRSNERNRQVVRQIIDTFSEVWFQFYQWEPDFCDQALESLAVTEPIDPVFTLDLSEDSISGTTLDPLSFGFLNWNHEHGVSEIRDIHHNTIQSISPHPQYLACTPSNSILTSTENQYIGTGRVEHKFMMFGDDPKFDEYRHSQTFGSFQWQRTWHDPDFHVVAFSALKRLLVPSLAEDDDQYIRETPLTRAEIDSQGIFPDQVAQMIFEIKERDPLFWSGEAFSSSKTIPPPPLSQNLDSLVHNMATQFCPYMDCIRFQCILHAYAGEIGCRGPQEPRLTSTQLLEKANNAQKNCGVDCFIHIKNINHFGQPREAQEIHDLLQMVPDALPCEIAAVLKVECNQVFVFRCRLWPDDSIVRPMTLMLPRRRQYIETMEEPFNYVVPYPCMHTGPCDERSDCGCFKENVYCQRNCHCDQTCTHRFRGCNCKGICKRDCPCVRMHWECTPGLCHTLSGRKKQSKTYDSCVNMKMQKHIPPKLEVKPGAYGSGVFAVASIETGTFLGEYIAEVFSNHAYDAYKSAVWEHLGLNYNFTLHKRGRLDALTVGNETRYVNDGVQGPGGSLEKKNVDVLPKVVNGEHRLMFITAKKIEKGKELLWDYGAEYWKEAKAKASSQPKSSLQSPKAQRRLERIEEEEDEEGIAVPSDTERSDMDVDEVDDHEMTLPVGNLDGDEDEEYIPSSP